MIKDIIFFFIPACPDLWQVNRISVLIGIHFPVCFIKIGLIVYGEITCRVRINRWLIAQKAFHRRKDFFANTSVREGKRNKNPVALFYGRYLAHFHIGNGLSACLIGHRNFYIIAQFQTVFFRFIRVGIDRIFLLRRYINAGIVSVLTFAAVFQKPKLGTGVMQKTSCFINASLSAEKLG